VQSVFNQNELLRYQRHFPVIGMEGQQKLKNAKILCVGAGGLGCPALQYLAASGVGTLGIIDGDQVELSNLQRQILFSEKDLGRNKADAIAEKLNLQNSNVLVKTYSSFLSETNATEILSSYDVILDATDNYRSRYLLNTICRTLRKPLISASIYQFDAQISVFNYCDGPCYQCLYPEPPPSSLIPNCAMGGVLGVLPGVAGILQATEAIKILLELGNVASGMLLTLDLLTLQFNRYEIAKQDCHTHPELHFDREEKKDIPLISVDKLAFLLNHPHSIQLIDVREVHERAICHIGGIHIPLSELELQLAQLEKTTPTVVYCKSGGRSAIACDMLLAAEFKDVRSLNKGILEWINVVDNGMMRY
jgi:molybdopterin/thiamine biosynthesis adenylyltransferase/rhodanese-related sulfurtransferase